MRIDARAYEAFRAVAADLTRQERRVARRARIDSSARISRANRKRLDANAKRSVGR